MNIPISILINTRNEEKNILNCLKSATWADEIVIIDMQSEDRTLEIATAFTSKIFSYEKCGYVEPAREFGVSKTSNNWVLILDADEIIPPSLAQQLREIANNNLAEVVWIPRRNFFFGKEMLGGGTGATQDYQLRFFKKANLKFSDKIHSFPKISIGSKEFRIKNPNHAINHFSYLTSEQFLEKINTYTTKEAEFRYKNNQKLSLFKTFLYFIRDGFYNFFIRKGYKDGMQGLLLCWILSTYFVMVKLKIYLLETFDDLNLEERIRKEYQNYIERQALNKK